MFGPVLGELWVTWADLASDLPGKFRFAPKKKTTLSNNNYLYVTMEVDTVSTSRRYPQILISDHDVPIQDYLDKSKTIIVQIFGDWPNRYELQVCNQRPWDVNNQCDAIPFRERSPSTIIPPIPEVGELAGVDKPTLFDVYISTKRAFLFLDNMPYGCVNLDSSTVPNGQVTVTFGDVLYHSGADGTVSGGQYRFHQAHQYIETKRHFDNLGFKAGVAQPSWDFNRFPCHAASEIGSDKWN